MSQLQDLAEQVERLLLRHQELQRTNALLEQQLASVTQERDSLRSRPESRREPHRCAAARAPAGRSPRQQRERIVSSIEVTIIGQGYRLGSAWGGEAPLLAAAAAVDREMSASAMPARSGARAISRAWLR